VLHFSIWRNDITYFRHALRSEVSICAYRDLVVCVAQVMAGYSNVGIS
jgi:hypothetical protein